MSNSLFMDESNGNGLFAIKAQQGSILPTSISNDDLSQSLSEYTDADESISAPTEFLAEFLSAVMLKDYKKALKYCKLILQYEPNNATAKEFYPLIQEKLKCDLSSESDENYNKSSSPEVGLMDENEMQCANESDLSNDSHDGDDGVDNSSADNSSGGLSSSASGEVEGEIEGEGEGDGDGEGEGEPEADSDSEDATSSDLDENHLDMVLNSGNSSSGGEGEGGRSRSDNTTHSYSSLLLEDDDDIVPPNLHLNKELSSPDLDISNGNNIVSASCSDSESPTEPLTQRLAAILRSKYIPRSSQEAT